MPGSTTPTDQEMLAIQSYNEGQTTLQGGVQKNEFLDNFNPAFTNAISFDNAHARTPGGVEASGLGSTLGSIAGTLGRVAAGAGTGAILGSAIPGAGTAAGAGYGALGALGLGNIGSFRAAEERAGHNPNSAGALAGQALMGAAPFALGALPVAQSGNLAQQVFANAGIQGLGTGAIDAGTQYATTGKIDPQQLGTSAALGALGGGAIPLGRAGLNGMLSRGSSAANYLDDPLQAQAQQAAQTTGSLSQQTLQEYQALVGAYARNRQGGDPAQLQALGKTIFDKFGIDPETAAAQYLRNTPMNYQSNASQQLDQVGQQAGQLEQQLYNQKLQTQAGIGNLQAQDAMRYQPELIPTPNAYNAKLQLEDIPMQRGPDGAISAGVRANDVYEPGPVGELDPNDLAAWMHRQEVQNYDLGTQIEREMAGRYTPTELPQTPNSDALAAQARQEALSYTPGELPTTPNADAIMSQQAQAAEDAANEQLANQLLADYFALKVDPTGLGDIATPTADAADQLLFSQLPDRAKMAMQAYKMGDQEAYQTLLAGAIQNGTPTEQAVIQNYISREMGRLNRLPKQQSLEP